MRWVWFAVFVAIIAVALWATERAGRGLKPHPDKLRKGEKWRVDDASPGGTNTDRTFG